MSLAAVATYLPDRVLLTDLPELADLGDGERTLCLALGIERVTVDKELSTVDLAVRAGRQTLATAGLSPHALDGVILVEARAPGTLASSEATGLQAALGADAAWAFSIGGLGCASIVPALLTARGLLAADPEISHILVAHGSRPVASRRYRHPVTVNGDSGQAVVVSREGPLRVRDILLETNGAYWDLFQVDYRGNPPQDWREVCADLPRYTFSLAVESRKRIAALNRRLLERNGVDQDDISCYVGQNLSTAALRVIGESLGVKISDGCLDNLRENGHLGPNDALLNLSTAIDSGELPEGGRAVVLNMSPAAAWSAMLVEHHAPDNRTICL
ncbi:3-oxoacyl-[acyl-carrier-protein] synthase III C-terminal domain-containing protein [Plantactinospora solaniradicis]|uniref:3-oxoacyl-[acyl-carrier-protein] synthase III C-terminal domain-containing protein n=1 Tax=Plantactinospora solaniradicis TaxID=1723736 RepID=A0ABW1KIV9_9ACTN